MSSDAALIATDIDAYLAQHERKELVRLLTCGSVDDGKSTLIGRLLYDTQMIYEDQLAAVRRDSERHGHAGGELDLALLTDGLRAEREQGITIDVAYRYFSTSRRKFIIADTPGHEQYTRNMATGASTCDLAIILIDARNGVAPQTRRHSFIASLLGIRHIVVAVNKMDLVGYDEQIFEAIKEDYSAFAARLELNDIRFIPMSALQGDNVVEPGTRMPWYQGETLMHYLETVHIASDRNLIDFRFPVQYVLRPHAQFRGFSGIVASGVVRKGDAVTVLPSGARSGVKEIITWEGSRPEAFAPMAVTLTLDDEIDVSRGDMIVHPNNLPRVERTFEAMLVWMAEDTLVPDKQYWFKQTTNLVAGAVTALRYRVEVNSLRRVEAPVLRMNEVGRCEVTLNRPIALDPYRENRATGAFVVIDRLTNNTVGAGMIVARGTSARVLEDHWEPDAAALRAHEWRASQVSLEERAQRFSHQPATILLTGLAGSGKSTIAYALERRLFDEGCAVAVLDGGQLRQTISRDLGFTAAERSENLRRATDIARLMNDAGLICIGAFLAPSAAVREKARAALGAERFLEVHLSAPVEVCRERDGRGMYAKADSGEIPDFPGATAQYDVPVRPDLTLPTHELSVDECVDRLMAVLRERGLIG